MHRLFTLLVPLLLVLQSTAPAGAQTSAADEAQVQTMRAAFMRDDHAGFITLARARLDTLAARGQGRSEEAADLWFSIGTAQLQQEEWPAAEASARAALGILRSMRRPPATLFTNSLRLLAVALDWQGSRRGESRRLQRQILVRSRQAGDAATQMMETRNLARFREPPLAVSAAERADLKQAADALTADIRARRWPSAEAAARALLARIAAINPRHSDAAGAHMALALALNGQGKRTAALAEYQMAHRISRTALGDDHPDTASIARELATMLLNNGQTAAAEALLRPLLASRVQLLGERHASSIDVMELLAECHETQGQLAAAEELRRRLLAVAAADSEDAGARLHDLAANLQRQGRLNEAERYFRQALVIRQGKLGPTHATTLATEHELSGLLLARGDRLGALDLARHVLDARNGRFGPTALPTILAAIRLTDIFIAFNDAAAAEPILLVFLKQADADPAFRPHVRAALNTALANVREAVGRWAEAEAPRRQALAHARQRNAAEQATALTALAGNLEHQGKTADAQASLQEARRLVIGSLGQDHPQLAGIEEALAALHLAASPHPDSGKALAAATRALGLQRARAVRESLGEDERRQSFHAGTAERAALLVARAAFAAGNGPARRAIALGALQSGSSSAAGRALARSAARAAVPASAATLLQAWETALAERNRIEALTIRAFDRTDGDADPQRQQLARDRVAADTAVAAAAAALDRAAPAYFRLVAPGPVSLKALQRGHKGQLPLLKANEALIVLHPGSTSLPTGQQNGLVLAITREGTAWAQIPIGPAALAREIAALRCELDHGGGADNSACIARTVKGLRGGAAGTGPISPEERESFDRARAHRLYQALLGTPAIQRLISGKTEWIMAPKGSLLALPFAALVTTAPAGDDSDPQALRGTAWLGLQRPISVVPEVSALAALRGAGRMQRLASTPFFGVGDPAFGGSTGVGTGGGALRGLYRDATGDPAAIAALEPLPGTRAEVENQARRLAAPPEATLLGANATEARLYERRSLLASARVVMFATHGLLAGDLGGRLAQPALALSPPPAGSGNEAGNDGLLTAAEAAGLSLSADWVILSACNTAAGDGGPEGLSGLARAFFHAGAGSLLVSHWRIRDDAAGRITSEAIARAQPGTSRAAALMQAMRALAADTSEDAAAQPFSHPSAWAPFALVGVTP